MRPEPARGLSRLKRGGQVIVELLLILPVFFLMLFLIMEIGNIAFQTILVQHCAYELARIGSLIAGPSQNKSQGGGSLSCSSAKNKMEETLKEMFPQNYGQTDLDVDCYDSPRTDPQTGTPNTDIMVTLTYKAKLFFPGPNTLLADAGKGYRKIIATVKMPIERPVFQ